MPCFYPKPGKSDCTTHQIIKRPRHQEKKRNSLKLIPNFFIFQRDQANLTNTKQLISDLVDILEKLMLNIRGCT